MSPVFLSLDHRGWRLVRSEACLDRECKPVPEARREYWARQWLQGFKCDSSRMLVLRQMLSKDSQGMAIDRVTDDDLVDRSVHLLTLGVWHIHSLDRAKLRAQPTKEEEPEAPKENWKRATSVGRHPGGSTQELAPPNELRRLPRDSSSGPGSRRGVSAAHSRYTAPNCRIVTRLTGELGPNPRGCPGYAQG